MNAWPLLLATKLNAPPARPQLVARSRLTALLDEGRPFTLISAPPGFGKTTLLSEWLVGRDQTPLAWLSLDADDNDPTRFLSYLAAALNRAIPGMGEAAQALIASPQLLDQRTVATALINALNDAKCDVILVLDDYHVIDSQAVHEVVSFLLDHRPALLRLCVTTRADPPLPLSRLRARGELLEIRVGDLRFTQGEAAQFLETVMGVRLTTESLTALSARTEGWIAGLQLAALSMRGREDVSGFVSAFAGSNAYIVDYLADEVLRQQPAHIEQFLLHTAILDRLNGSLCDAVVERADSSAILERLERGNLFVVPLDAERQWYRYHHLFRDVLLHRLKSSGDDVSALHRRASNWHERHGDVAEAVNHALVANSVDRAADLLETWGASVGQSGRIQQALAWFAALPEAVVRNRPGLCVIHAGLLAHVSQPDAAEARMQDAERCLERQPDTPVEEVNIVRGRMAGIRAEIARSRSDFAQCVVLARQALALLPKTEAAGRERLSMYVLLDFLLTGNVTDDADRQQAQLAEASRAAGNLVSHVSGITTLGWMRLYRGELHKAAATFEQAIASWEAIGVGDLGLSMFCRLGLAEVLREWGRWEDAEAHLVRGLALIHESPTPDANLVWLVAQSLTRLKQAQGDFADATEVLARLVDVSRTHHLGELLDVRLTAIKAWLHLALGDLAAAKSWAKARVSELDDGHVANFQREAEYLILARVWIAQGRTDQNHANAHDALTLMDKLLPTAESGARMKSVIEMLMLRALALQAHGDMRSALVALDRALALAEPEGYLRLFVDEGEPIRELLQRLEIGDSRLQAYREGLLAAFASSGAPSPISSLQSPLVEPLSARELEVLRLVADGLSDRQIAERMIVATGTVKRHLNNLYGKLGVHSRTAALARARALGLL